MDFLNISQKKGVGSETECLNHGLTLLLCSLSGLEMAVGVENATRASGTKCSPEPLNHVVCFRSSCFVCVVMFERHRNIVEFKECKLAGNVQLE